MPALGFEPMTFRPTSSWLCRSLLAVVALLVSHQIGPKLEANASGDFGDYHQADLAKNKTRLFPDPVHPDEQLSNCLTNTPAQQGPGLVEERVCYNSQLTNSLTHCFVGLLFLCFDHQHKKMSSNIVRVSCFFCFCFCCFCFHPTGFDVGRYIVGEMMSQHEWELNMRLVHMRHSSLSWWKFQMLWQCDAKTCRKNFWMLSRQMECKGKKVFWLNCLIDYNCTNFD